MRFTTILITLATVFVVTAAYAQDQVDETDVSADGFDPSISDPLAGLDEDTSFDEGAEDETVGTTGTTEVPTITPAAVQTSTGTVGLASAANFTTSPTASPVASPTRALFTTSATLTSSRASLPTTVPDSSSSAVRAGAPVLGMVAAGILGYAQLQ